MAIPKGTTVAFIHKARQRWGIRYDYQLVEYKNSRTPVIIMCRKHQQLFLQTPKAHFAAKYHCCPLCYKEVSGVYQNQWRQMPVSKKPDRIITFPPVINKVFC